MRAFWAPERTEVLAAAGAWAASLRRTRPEVGRVGLFGSYARGNYAPGSDLDILVVVRHSPEPRWFLRTAQIDTSTLPVGVDLFVFTDPEVERLQLTSAWFRHIVSETIWLE